MSAATLVSVEEFERLPDPEDGYLELHEGEIVLVSTPDLMHNRLQKRLLQLISQILDAQGYCSTEQPFSGGGKSRMRADVGFTIWERVRNTLPHDVIEGSPDFVIEVDSPSNKEREMARRRRICFASGCTEYWTVFPDERCVRVERPGTSVEYWPGQSVPVPFGDGAVIHVEAIFEDVE